MHFYLETNIANWYTKAEYSVLIIVQLLNIYSHGTQDRLHLRLPHRKIVYIVFDPLGK